MQRKGIKVAPDRTPVTMTETVLPSHTNALGTVFGGVVMAWIDIAGAIAAKRYSRSNVVTVSVDYMHFIVPMKTGYTVVITAEVTFVGKTSMEVEITVEAENSTTGEIRQATHAYLTYVAVDEFGRPRAVTPMQIKTAKEKQNLEAAKIRRKRRLEWKDT